MKAHYVPNEQLMRPHHSTDWSPKRHSDVAALIAAQGRAGLRQDRTQASVELHMHNNNITIMAGFNIMHTRMQIFTEPLSCPHSYWYSLFNVLHYELT